jgi:hypothetical protein
LPIYGAGELLSAASTHTASIISLKISLNCLKVVGGLKGDDGSIQFARKTPNIARPN